MHPRQRRRRRTWLWLPLLLGASAAAQVWFSLPPLDVARQEIAGAWLGDRIVVVGGFGADRAPLASAEAWAPGAAAWTALPPMPLAVHHPAAAVLGGRLYVVGGYTAAGALHGATDAVQVFDPEAGSWRLGAPLPTARGGLAAAVVDGRLVAVGGASEHGGAVGDVAAYDPERAAWTVLAPLPTPRDHLAVAVVDGRLHVVGGRDGRSFTLDAHEVYDPAADAWRAAAPLPTGRSGHAAAAVAGCMVVVGGEGNRGRPDGLFDEVERYDPDGDAWTALPPMAAPRHGMAALADGVRLYVVGGADVAGFGAVRVVDALDLPPCR
jgi:N-acetylneuraminic acid mutarotase